MDKYSDRHLAGMGMRQWAYTSAILMALTLIVGTLVILSAYSVHRNAAPKSPAGNALSTPTASLTTPTSTQVIPSSAPAESGAGDWSTYMADNGRSGFNAAEKIITPATAPHLGLKWTHASGGYIGAEPVEANRLIYWGSWDGFEYATNVNNKLAWSTNLGTTSDEECGLAQVGVTSSATVASVTIKGVQVAVDFVAGGNGNFYALDAYSGAIIWKTFLGAPPDYYLWSSPAVYKGSVYIGVSSLGDCPLVLGKFIQLDAATGKIQHTFDTVPNGCTGGSIWSSPAIDEAKGTIYVSTGNSGMCWEAEPYTNALIELHASDLSLAGSWQLPFPEWIRDGDFGATPTLFTTGAGMPMVGLENKNGKYYAFKRDALHSGPMWEARIASGRGSMSSSAWDGHRLYVAGRTIFMDGTFCTQSVVAMNPDTGAISWQRCLTNGVVPGVPDGEVSGAVAAVPGLVVYGQGPDMMVFDATSGKLLYTYHDTESGSCFRGWASISNGVVYMGNADGKLYAFEPQ